METSKIKFWFNVVIWSIICFAFFYVLIIVKNNMPLTIFSIVIIVYGASYIYLLFTKEDNGFIEILKILVVANVAWLCFANDMAYIGIAAIAAGLYLLYTILKDRQKKSIKGESNESGKT